MMRQAALLLAVLSIDPLALAQSEPDCRAIAAATVAELRAGYAEWNEAAEQLARAAAGAACVKAAVGGPVAPSTLSSTAVSGATGGTAVEAPATAAATDDEAEGAVKPDDEAWSPFADLKFNKVSASPSKKPYQRRREADASED